MYNLPLSGLNANALLQYTLLGDNEIDKVSKALAAINGKAYMDTRIFESSGTNIPTTLDEFISATGLEREKIVQCILSAILALASTGLNYKTIFTKCNVIMYQLNGKQDLYRDDIAARTLAFMIEDYAKNTNNSTLPTPISGASEFNIPAWVFSDICRYHGRPLLGRCKSDFAAFKEMFERNRQTFKLNQDLVPQAPKPIKGPFAQMLYYADLSDKLCCSVNQGGVPLILYRFIDIMALRDNIIENHTHIDFDKVIVDRFEEGSENAKLYQFEEYNIPLGSNDKTIKKPSEVFFNYNSQLFKTAGEQDKNVKKMFYKLLVLRTFDNSYTNLFDLITGINGYYSGMVYDYKYQSNTSNSVTLLIDSINAYDYSDTIRSSLESFARTLIDESHLDEEDMLQLSNVISDLSSAAFMYYSKNSGHSEKILSDAAITQLMPLAYSFVFAHQVDECLIEQQLSWRSLRKLYQELGRSGTILTFSDTTIDELYQQLQFIKKQSIGSEVEYVREIPKLTPVFPTTKIQEVSKLVYRIEFPLSLSTVVNEPNLSEDANEIMFEKISNLLREHNNVSLQGIVLSLKGCIKYLHWCELLYKNTLHWSDSAKGKISSLFALLFDRKVVELNDNIERLTTNTTLRMVTTTNLTSFTSVLFDTLLRNKDYKIPYCLKESLVFDMEQIALEEVLNQEFEQLLKDNPKFIENLKILHTAVDEINLPQYKLGSDLHYRAMGTNRLIIESLGDAVWGIRNCVKDFTRVRYEEATEQWMIEGL